MGLTVFQMLLHVIWSLIDPLEIACDDLVSLHAVFEYFRLPSFIFSLDSSHNWVIPFDSEYFVSNLVELLHLALSQQCAEFLDILNLLKGTCDRELLLFLLCLVAVVVPDGYVSYFFC